MTKKKQIKRKYSVLRIVRRFLLSFACNSFFIIGKHRAFLLKFAGISIENPASCFIGRDTYFDELFPEGITIGQGTYITSGVKILTHFMDTEKTEYTKMYTGEVKIGRNVFIGINALIVKPITIGDNAIIAAGSVVVSDIESNTIYGGNPARKIKEINTKI